MGDDAPVQHCALDERVDLERALEAAGLEHLDADEHWTIVIYQRAIRATVTKLVGGPGTGKTTRLLDYIEAEASSGTGLTDLQVSTFTRAGQAEMRDHIEDVYPTGTRDEYRDAVRTVHGVALKCCFDADLFALRSPNPDAAGLWLWADDEESHAARRAFFDRRFPA